MSLAPRSFGSSGSCELCVQSRMRPPGRARPHAERPAPPRDAGCETSVLGCPPYRPGCPAGRSATHSATRRPRPTSRCRLAHTWKRILLLPRRRKGHKPLPFPLRPATRGQTTGTLRLGSRSSARAERGRPAVRLPFRRHPRGKSRKGTRIRKGPWSFGVERNDWSPNGEFLFFSLLCPIVPSGLTSKTRVRKGISGCPEGNSRASHQRRKDPRRDPSENGVRLKAGPPATAQVPRPERRPLQRTDGDASHLARRGPCKPKAPSASEAE